MPDPDDDISAITASARSVGGDVVRGAPAAALATGVVRRRRARRRVARSRDPVIATAPTPHRSSRSSTRCGSSELLEADGIPVAHVYGWVDDPPAFVIDVVPGENNFDTATDASMNAVMDEYMGILARIHAARPRAVRARRHHPRRRARAQSGRVGLDVYVAGYRATKVRPDPFLEFCLGWIDRNPVDTQGREAPVVWDSGQFHQQDGRVTAILDLELGHIGDPMMDLAAFRMRDTVLGFGDMNVLYDQYAKHSGAPVDLDAIMHHHFVFALTNQLVFHAALAEPPAASDYMTNMQWASETNLFALEGLAEIMGVDELDTVEMPEPRRSPVANAHEHLVRSLRSLDLADEYERHQLRIVFRLARHLQRFDEIGDDVHRGRPRRPAGVPRSPARDVAGGRRRARGVRARRRRRPRRGAAAALPPPVPPLQDAAAVPGFGDGPRTSPSRHFATDRRDRVLRYSPAMLRFEQDGAVTVVTLDRPEARNAIDGPMAQAIEDAITRIEDDDSLMVGIVTHTGDVFCSGADLEGGPAR